MLSAEGMKEGAGVGGSTGDASVGSEVVGKPMGALVLLTKGAGVSLADLDPSSSTTSPSVGNGVMPVEGVGKGVPRSEGDGKGVPRSTALTWIEARNSVASFEGCSNTVLVLLKLASTPPAAEANAKVKATGSFIVGCNEITTRRNEVDL